MQKPLREAAFPSGMSNNQARDLPSRSGIKGLRRRVRGRTSQRRCTMTKKPTTAKAKVAAPSRPKKLVQRKKRKARWQEEAVIHQDVFFAEAPTEQ
jgi:hypothetical protein